METPLNQWINQKLNQKGWSIRELARQAQIDPSYLSKILSGKREPNLVFFQQIARALDIPVSTLLRVAGVLPEENSFFSELHEIGQKLPPEEQREILEYALYRLWKKQRQSNEEP